MSTHNRRSSFSSSTTSSLAKRQVTSSDNVSKYMAVPPRLAKKRAPFDNITNQRNVATQTGSKSSLSSSALVPCSTEFAKAKKTAVSGSSGNTSISGNILSASTNSKTTSAAVTFKIVSSFPRGDETVHCKNTSFPRSHETGSIGAIPVACNMDVSPGKSDGNSVSMDESMSVYDSFRSPEIGYIYNNDAPRLDSIDRNTFRNLYISDPT